MMENKEHYEIQYVSFRKIVYKYKTSTIIQTTTMILKTVTLLNFKKIYIKGYKTVQEQQTLSLA